MQATAVHPAPKPMANPYNVFVRHNRQAAPAARTAIGMLLAATLLGGVSIVGGYAFADEMVKGGHVRKELAVAGGSHAARTQVQDAMIGLAMPVQQQAEKLVGRKPLAAIANQKPMRSAVAQAAARHPVEIDDKGAPHEIVTRAADLQASAYALNTPAASPRVVGVVGQVKIGDGPALDVVQGADGSVRYVVQQRES